jgi:hypothetical protein
VQFPNALGRQTPLPFIHLTPLPALVNLKLLPGTISAGFVLPFLAIGRLGEHRSSDHPEEKATTNDQ